MEPAIDSRGTATDPRTVSQEGSIVNAGAQTDEVLHPYQTSEPLNSVLQANSLHSEERPEALYGQVQGDVSSTLDTNSGHLFIDISVKQLEGQFVDVELFDEWTEGYVIKVTEEFATVIVNHPFLSGEHIQRISIESITSFRTKTTRSSLTSHLETCLKKRTSLDFESLLRVGLLQKQYKLSLKRFIQFFAGVLPLGSSAIEHMNQESTTELFKSLIYPSLIAFFRNVVYEDPEVIKRVWLSVQEVELKIFQFLSERAFERTELVVAHLEAISSTYCPACVVKTFKDLMQYCTPSMEPHLSTQMTLQGTQLKTYVEAGLVYIDYCIRCVKLAEAQSVLTQLQIAKLQCYDPILDAKILNQILQDLPHVKHISLSQLKADLQILLLSSPYPRGVPSIDDLLAWSLVDSANIHYFLTKAPSVVSLTFLRCCSSPSEVNIYRNLIRSKVEILEEVIINASDVYLSSLSRVIKHNYLLCNTSTDLNTQSRLLQVRYFQFITNVLHRISPIHNEEYPQHWKDLMRSYLAPELVSFFKGYPIYPQAEIMQEDWLTAVELENIVLKSLSDQALPIDLLIVHLETIANSTSHDFIVNTFKVIRPYCGPFYHRTKNTQMLVQRRSGNEFDIYMRAAFEYFGFCINSDNWLEAIDFLLAAEESYSLLTDRQWDSYLRQFTGFMFERASFKVKFHVVQLLLSPTCSEVNTDFAPAKLMPKFANHQRFLTAACLVCVSLVENYKNATYTSLLDRLAAEMSVLVRLPRQLVISHCFALRGYWTPSSLRKVEEIANFMKLQRQVSLWVYEKAKSLQRIPRTLMQEIVVYL